MTSILILGGDGMLGHKMMQVLGAVDGFAVRCTIRGSVDDEFHSKIPLYRRDNTFGLMDALNTKKFIDLVASTKPDYIVNCIGIIKQRKWISEQMLPCLKVNTLLPQEMASIAARTGSKVIHFSSDCVFDGEKGDYAEDDEQNALSVYGKTKALGEIADVNSLTLRTSFIGRELRNNLSLLEWFLSQRGKQVSGFTRAAFSGVTSNFLCGFVRQVIQQHHGLHGLYHLTAETVNKYELLCLLRDKYGVNDIEIRPDDRYDRDVVCNRSMKSDKLSERIGYVVPSWEQLATELVADETPYDVWKKEAKE